jgi:hypothetical protein
MQRMTAKIGLSTRSPRDARYRQAWRVAWLGAFLVATSLSESSRATVPGGGGGSRGGQQVFRLGGWPLASTRAG